MGLRSESKKTKEKQTNPKRTVNQSTNQRIELCVCAQHEINILFSLVNACANLKQVRDIKQETGRCSTSKYPTLQESLV